MCAIMQTLTSVDFLKFALPLGGAVFAWFMNEWRKRISDQYQRKESNYKELLRSLRGFYQGVANSEKLKGDFLDQLNIAWLYSPDEVIRKGYAFLKTTDGANRSTDAQREKAFGDFVAAIRADLLSRKLVKSTELEGGDFKHYGVKP